ncbi:FAD:protein FMN transferase [Nocardioides sp. CER19]|uniref:FAD:protein FMN transferase n=1 Tax=Nocardioides sp. CER19 TaxID=3038538 RepID=UPI002449C824|nr:FAD:protein FMN transferase [Nocardioides sp. CER19]MDH2415983.1 FAD:protein FMN transferase [Nocardioides sp. CER19]
MSERSWRDWSCTVRVLVGQGEPVTEAVVDDAAAIVATLMADVDRAASRFRADSEVQVVNDAAPRLLPVGPLALTLVEAALDAARSTDGAVDPTVGHQVAACGYDDDIDVVRRRGACPPSAGVEGAPADWRRVTVDRSLGRVGVGRGLRLDLGATAKAWTADEAARRVAARHRYPALVEIGGDVAVAGPADAPWPVRVAEVAGGPGEVVGVTHGGLATSSTLERRWRTASGDAHHVIDPRTGRPTDGPLRTAAVWARSCVLANTFSTAALVWGAAAALRLERAGVSARLVDRSGSVRRVGTWPVEERAA